MDHPGPGERPGKPLTALPILLDQDHTQVAPLQDLRQHHRRDAPPGDHHLLGPLFHIPEKLSGIPRPARRHNDRNLIFGAHLIIRPGNGDLPFPGDRHRQHAVLPIGRKEVPDQASGPGGASPHRHLPHLHLPLRKGLHGNGSRVLDQLGDLKGRQRLRVNDQIDA